LFDMDGTIIDSTLAIINHWTEQAPLITTKAEANRIRIAQEIGVDPNVILESSHGRRTIDVLKDYDESKANWECKGVFSSIQPWGLRSSQTFGRLKE